jgi:hypothetical protein
MRILRPGLLCLMLAAATQAVAAPFDLAGPTLTLKVTRGATVLPAAAVPNLVVGDQLRIRAQLPASQSVQYLLVTAFLRGSTNPPPEDWFFACRTWKEACGRDGLKVTVPQGAGQVLVFLAPATHGDLSTLVGTVRARPGVFVRASQDLNQAALDRSRLERYLLTVRSLNDADPSRLKDAAPLLARSLAIRTDDKCLQKVAALQAPCLVDGGETLILNDGHSTSIVQALTSGPGSDLAMEASYTPQLGYGYYSPYVASVMDLGRLLDSFHTAQYQYIPALALPQGDELRLTLNTAPSFDRPKSVLVAALPAVEQPQQPPLHAVDPKENYCATRTALVLPVEGAPLVFATDYAHDMALTAAGGSGTVLKLPVHADAAQGGYVVETAGADTRALGASFDATLQGFWGFDAYLGPHFHLVTPPAAGWRLDPADDQPLLVGRANTLHLQADTVSCLDRIVVTDAGGREVKAEWRRLKPDEVEVKLPLQDSQPGALSLKIAQYGGAPEASIPLIAYADAGRFDGFELHAGDSQGVLKGSRLDLVTSLVLGGLHFAPGEMTSWHGSDELPMLAQDPAAAAALQPKRGLEAQVALSDGRKLRVPVSMEPARPRVALIARNVQPAPGAAAPIELAGPDEIPQDAKLTFSVRAVTPATFTHDETLEIATNDELYSATLSLANGGLRLEDAHVAVALLDPTRIFGGSAFGPLRFRVLAGGAVGDWQPLATLVRLPQLDGLACPQSADLACKLTGMDLYLLDSVAGDAQFAHAVSVPDGFPGNSIPVPRPQDGRLYLRLRDAPAGTHTLTLQIQALPATAEELSRAAARQEAVTPVAPPIAAAGGTNP